MKKSLFCGTFMLVFGLTVSPLFSNAQNVYFIDAKTSHVYADDYRTTPQGGDTIKILSGRTAGMKFKGFQGDKNTPIIFINEGGQVNINTSSWGALVFENCKYIKVSGTGDPNYHYGFKLKAKECGLSFSEYSSDCEVEFIEIEGDEKSELNKNGTFFGIVAKKDFHGKPPVPYPVFNNLIIHDTYIHHVAEGMYIGETTSPGMEFSHVKIYNNVVTNTFRESVQIANCIKGVEINNNIFLNAGTENLLHQNNALQIGANSVANVFDNIILNSPRFGVIILGNGDITLNNNYIQNNRGIYIDNRLQVIPNSSIRIENNYFDQIDDIQVIENRNEFMNLFILNNTYNPQIKFLKNVMDSNASLVEKNNKPSEISNLQYKITKGVFQNSSANKKTYQLMGPKSLRE